MAAAARQRWGGGDRGDQPPEVGQVLAALVGDALEHFGSSLGHLGPPLGHLGSELDEGVEVGGRRGGGRLVGSVEGTAR